MLRKEDKSPRNTTLNRDIPREIYVVNGLIQLLQMMKQLQK